jgi:hypothetical protein
MAERQGPPNRNARPRGKSPAERADEFAALQRRMKQDAAARREAGAKRASAQPGSPKGRRTP